MSAPWYRSGTATLANGSRSVTGAGTDWIGGGVQLGDVFTADNVNLYEIQGLADDTHLTLDRPFAGSSAAGSAYSIIRNFSPGNAAMMSSVVALTGAVDTLIDGTLAPNLGSLGAFQPAPQATPNMTVQVSAAVMMQSGGPVVVSAQVTPVLVAPVSNPRVDLLVADAYTGAVSVIQGTEAASPVLPAMPAATIPLARLSMSPGMAAIGAAQITDLRPLYDGEAARGCLNAKSYGIVGDALTPCGAQLQAAINAAASISAGQPYDLLIPAGRYLIDITLSIPSNIRLRGAAGAVYGKFGTSLIRAGDFTLISVVGTSSTAGGPQISATWFEELCFDGGDHFGSGAQASGTISFAAACSPGDWVKVRGVQFTAVSLGAPLTATTFTGGVSQLADAASLLAQLKASGNATVQTCTYRASGAGQILVTAITAGTTGNAYSLAESSAHVSVSGGTLSGGGARWLSDMVHIEAAYELKFYRVWFYGSAGRGIYAQELWDSRFVDCRFTALGSQDGTLPAVTFHSGPSHAGGGDQTTNNVYFWGGRFESNPGVCFESTGSNAVDYWFTDTKFECTQTQLDYLIRAASATAIHLNPVWMYVAPNWGTYSWTDSGTTLTPTVGTISLTIASGDTKIYAAASTAAQPCGMSVLVYATGAPRSAWMTGRVTSYDPSTGAINIVTDQAAGSSQTGWTIKPCHPGLLYATGSQLIDGKIYGGMVTGNPFLPGSSAVPLKAFVHFDNSNACELQLRITQGTGNLIGHSVLAYHDTTTSGTVGPGTHNFTVETGQSIAAGDILYVCGTGGFAWDSMTGRVVSYDPSTGALQIQVDQYGWSGVNNPATDTLTVWIILSAPANAVLITNPPSIAALGNNKLNVTGSAEPYANIPFTAYAPQNVVSEGLTIQKFAGANLFQLRNMALQDRFMIDHEPDFTVVSGQTVMTGQYRFYGYDYARNQNFDVFRVDGSRNLAFYATLLINTGLGKPLRWYDQTQSGVNYSSATGLTNGGTGSVYNQVQIRGSVYGSASLPLDGTGLLTGSPGDVFWNSSLRYAGNGAPQVLAYVCTNPAGTSGGTPYPATWLELPPLQRSGTRAAGAALSTSGYAQGFFFRYTDPVAGDYEGQMLVDNGAGTLVWKKCRPLAA